MMSTEKVFLDIGVEGICHAQLRRICKLPPVRAFAIFVLLREYLEDTFK